MTVKKRSTPAIWSDPDDAAELTAEFFESADLYKGKKIKTRGRPPEPKDFDFSYGAEGG